MSSSDDTVPEPIHLILSRRTVPLLVSAMIFATGVAVALGGTVLIQRLGWERIGIVLDEYAWILFWTGLAEGLALAVGLIVFRCAFRQVTEPLTRLAQDAVRLTANGGTAMLVTDGQPCEIRQLAESLNELLSTRERQAAELRELTHNVLHDLRTPLTHIRLSAETLHDGKSEAVSTAESIAESCNALIGLVDMQTEISANYARISTSPAVEQDIRPIVADLAEMYSAVSEIRRIALDISMPKSPVVFRGHLHKLQRLVANLMDNAFKFTPEGGSVRVCVEADDAEVRIRVADSGIGISEQDRQHIYERFFRVDRSRKTPGSGLGLSLVHAIAAFYRGTVDCRSKLGCGTTFTVTLPLHQPN